MEFATALRTESTKTHTENGATAYDTTGDALLDLFATIGALRKADPARIELKFEQAYQQDPLLATKALFYARDIRGGLGERDTFRTILTYAAKTHPEAVRPNIGLIGHYGRYDDLYALLDTPLEAEMWEHVKAQLAEDEEAMRKKQPCSLLAKWLKTADASSKRTRALGIRTAKGLGLSVYVYKRRLRALRRYLKVVETKMSARQWSDIDYENVPSRAMHIYGNAFSRHDNARFKAYIARVANGEATIHSDTLYPYDIVEKLLKEKLVWTRLTHDEHAVLEAQWKALPDYIGRPANVLVIADTSGSMFGRPLSTAIGLAIYFAEHNQGSFHNLWMSFSDTSQINCLKGTTLQQKVASMDYTHWGWNTNLERAFQHVLDIAIDNDIAPEDMVETIIVISDMEIDACASSDWSFHETMRKRFEEAGYDIPNVVFWNVESRHDVFHTDAKRQGVQLCSGASASTFAHVIDSVGNTPVEMMMKVLVSERYDAVTIE